MYSVKYDLKRLLMYNYATLLTQCFSLIAIASIIIIAVPIGFRGTEKRDKVINGLSFVFSITAVTIAYIKSSKLIEIGGKLTLLLELEKEAFITENLMSQQQYLTAVSDSLIPVNIEPQYFDDQPSQNYSVTHHNQHNHAIEAITENSDVTVCPHCESQNINKNGTIEGKQRYRCKDCKKTF
jgi:hypothetical protein